MTRRTLARLPAAVLAVAAASCTAADPPPAPLADHAKHAALAWAAYTRATPADLAAAVKHADDCIGEFEGAANRKQVELSASKDPVPNGVVTDEQRLAVLKHGPINDVATCYYVKARAAAKLGQTDVAAAAAAAAERYPSARCWDPKGWLWSPAEAAARFKRRPDRADDPPHQAYAADGWEEFERGRFDAAAKLADRCVAEFLAKAQEAEAALAKAGTTYPTGEVPPAVKAAIMANAVLNDVGACLIIRGRSAEALGDRAAAVRAYRSAVGLGRSRVWDPRGWFWAPAETATDRLVFLR
jgi:tetratricopeptide (TPR) repeat protein